MIELEEKLDEDYVFFGSQEETEEEGDEEEDEDADDDKPLLNSATDDKVNKPA